MPTLVCVPIMVRDAHAALAEAAAAGEAGADAVEFRIDEFWNGDDPARDEDVERLVLGAALPCIVTCRMKAEGGSFEGEESARRRLFERLRRASASRGHSPRYLDIEWRAWGGLKPAFAGEGGAGLILSLHDFGTRPADLTRRVAAMASEPAAAVIKIAYRARSLRDNLELLDLLSETGRPTIALGIGEFGLLSRVLAPKFGGFLTFASLRAAHATAPGQPTLRELLESFRFRSIGPRTGVYGVIGWPVGHSRSPAVHNAGFGAVGHDGVFLPLPIASGDDAESSYASFKGTVLELIGHARLDFQGAAVTIPHKESLMRLARSEGWIIDADSEAVGAANTLRVDRDAKGRVERVWVRNTDVPAFRMCVDRAVPGVKGARAAVLGAGGVARAAAWALSRAGASVVVYGRDGAKAERLAASMPPNAGVVGAPWDRFPGSGAEIIVNATPVGMRGGAGEGRSPVDLAKVPGDGVTVFDTVYTPARTPLLEGARARGWRTVDGVSMFVQQAGMQFEEWTGRRAPLDLFERLARDEEGASES